jgi:hypothetical protein
LPGKNRNRKYFLTGALAVLAFVSCLTSCNKSTGFDCFKSTGAIEKVERAIPYFHSIQLNDNVNLYLVQSNQIKLELEAGKNLMNQIVTEVTGDSILVIGNNNSCNWVRSYNKPINVYLSFNELRNLEYRSVGDVTNADTLRSDSLQVDIYEGAGNIELTLRTIVCEVNLHYGTVDVVLNGRSNANIFYQLGAGKIDASKLLTGNVYLRNWSSNDMLIWATNFLSVEIKGLGNVYYKGNPGIQSSLIGEGKLIPMQ